MGGPFWVFGFFYIPTYPHLPTYLKYFSQSVCFLASRVLCTLLLAISISWGKEKIDIGGLGDVWVFYLAFSNN